MNAQCLICSVVSLLVCEGSVIEVLHLLAKVRVCHRPFRDTFSRVTIVFSSRSASERDWVMIRKSMWSIQYGTIDMFVELVREMIVCIDSINTRFDNTRFTSVVFLKNLMHVKTFQELRLQDCAVEFLSIACEVGCFFRPSIIQPFCEIEIASKNR